MPEQTTRRTLVHRVFRTIFAAAVAVAAGSVAFTPRPLYGQAAERKTAEQEYKNITQLKGTPADEVMPAMQFISASLGVDCTFCHVQGKFDADDKPQKKTAREMMAMQAMINKESFRGQRQVTCYSCHRGAARPVNVPPIPESDAPAPATPATTPPAAPASTVDSIIEKYVAAVGGADAIQKVSTRVMKGVIVAGGVATGIDVITKAPNKRVTIMHNSPLQLTDGSRANDSFTAFDGKTGWMGNSGRPARDMTIPESEAASLDAEFALPLRLKEIFPQLRRGRPEEIGGLQCEILNGSGPGRPAVRLYFDTKSGLLVRMVRYADTPVGRNPTQIDYADYRVIGSVKVPFRWTLLRTNGRFSIQINDGSENLPVDDAKFAKPVVEGR
jgi:photosynthetic reaction center cytochrome c subunit